MKNEIDARGLACPAPVLQTKDAVDKNAPNKMKIIVDNEAARQNVTRFLESQSYEVSSEKEGSDFIIIGNKQCQPDVAASPKPATDKEQEKIMIMVTTNKIGHGDDKLGEKLMAAFLKTLKEIGDDLWRIIFLNNGVKLTIEGSENLSVLKGLEDSGLSILVCGTCLDYFNLLEKKQVGETTNMLDIVTSMQIADKVINV